MIKSEHWKVRHPDRIVASTYSRLSLILLLLLSRTSVCANDGEGYGARGHFVFTVFDEFGKPTFKNTMMFDVKVFGDKWHIRTEPVIRHEGAVGYYEASSGTNNLVLNVTVLDSAYDEAQSPFGELRAELKRLKTEEVYFTNVLPPAVAIARSNIAVSRLASPVPAKSSTNQIKNDRVATVRNGRFPIVAPSGCALLWFAFTPPDPRDSDTNRVLLQVWDDGHPQETRFRRARWDQSVEPPYLISDAVFFWQGKRITSNGTVVDLLSATPNEPQRVAGHYHVSRMTNFNSLTIPLEFSLSRFESRQSKMAQPKLLSTTAAWVTQVYRVSGAMAMDASIAGKTFFSDYRVSEGSLKGDPITYLTASNSIPSVEQVKNTKAL